MGGACWSAWVCPDAEQVVTELIRVARGARLSCRCGSCPFGSHRHFGDGVDAEFEGHILSLYVAERDHGARPLDPDGTGRACLGQDALRQDRRLGSPPISRNRPRADLVATREVTFRDVVEDGEVVDDLDGSRNR